MAAKARFLAGLAAAAALLSACGSDPDATTSVDEVRAIVGGVFTANREPEQGPVVSEADVAATLASTNAAVALVNVDIRKSQALMVQIEQNGAFRTFATRDRQSVTTRGGMVTATRGLGGDLMSSDVSQILPLVSARRAGTASYTMRFLNPEFQTEALTYSCTVSPGERVPFALGAINTTGQAVVAKCSGEAGEFTNAFIVSNDGYILVGRQFLGDITDILTIQMARR